MHVPRCVWLSVLRVCGEGACSAAPSGKPRQLPLFVFNGLSKDPLSRAAESFCTLKKDGRKGGGAGASVYVWIPGSRRWGGLRKALRICTAPLGRMLIAQARSAPACPSPEPSLRPSPHPLLSKESHHLPPPATCKAIDTLFAPWAPVGCHCVCFPSAGSRGCHVEERRGLTQSASVVARREPWVWSGVPAGADNLPREAPAFACSCGKHRRGDLVLLGGLLQRGRGDPFEQGLCRESASAFRTCHPQRLPS